LNFVFIASEHVINTNLNVISKYTILNW